MSPTIFGSHSKVGEQYTTQRDLREAQNEKLRGAIQLLKQPLFFRKSSKILVKKNTTKIRWLII